MKLHTVKMFPVVLLASAFAFSATCLNAPAAFAADQPRGHWTYKLQKTKGNTENQSQAGNAIAVAALLCAYDKDTFQSESALDKTVASVYDKAQSAPSDSLNRAGVNALR